MKARKTICKFCGKELKGTSAKAGGESFGTDMKEYWHIECFQAEEGGKQR